MNPRRYADRPAALHTGTHPSAAAKTRCQLTPPAAPLCPTRSPLHAAVWPAPAVRASRRFWSASATTLRPWQGGMVLKKLTDAVSSRLAFFPPQASPGLCLQYQYRSFQPRCCPNVLTCCAARRRRLHICCTAHSACLVCRPLLSVPAAPKLQVGSARGRRARNIHPASAAVSRAAELLGSCCRASRCLAPQRRHCLRAAASPAGWTRHCSSSTSAEASHDVVQASQLVVWPAVAISMALKCSTLGMRLQACQARPPGGGPPAGVQEGDDCG